MLMHMCEHTQYQQVLINNGILLFSVCSADVGMPPPLLRIWTFWMAALVLAQLLSFSALRLCAAETYLGVVRTRGVQTLRALRVAGLLYVFASASGGTVILPLASLPRILLVHSGALFTAECVLRPEPHAGRAGGGGASVRRHSERVAARRHASRS